MAVNLAGGTHHAFPDRGEGFCVFNDTAVATRLMQLERRARRVAVLDLDVHQGNGTAATFKHDPSVFTLSVHGARNFPFQKEAGDLDVELPDGSEDPDYLEAVDRAVRTTFASCAPDLAFFLAGADPYHGDRFGRLAVTKAGLAERDRIVLDQCEKAGVPVAIVMSGGYAENIDDIVEIHFNTLSQAALRASGRPASAPLDPGAEQGTRDGRGT
jgi:acetoin utilization deacetylase AcuC-like enzyme